MLRMWWNGIHSRLKICRRKLAGSNPAIRTTKVPIAILAMGTLILHIVLLIHLLQSLFKLEAEQYGCKCNGQYICNWFC